MAKKRLSTHHIWWPKKKYPDKEHRSVQVRIPSDYHQEYHDFFIHNCRRERACWPDGDHCKFAHICCYHQTAPS
jgi:endonuclease III